MSRVANVKPETIAEASCIQNDATGPPTSIDRPIRSIDTPEAMGSNPNPVVKVVKNTGRKRKQPVWVAVCRRVHSGWLCLS